MKSAPSQSPELQKRIRLVRRDIGSMLFHFTRSTKQNGAGRVLDKILSEGKLKGTTQWSAGTPCVCFTEAPIQEFNSVFALNEIAANDSERPRYEPYGVAVSKKWLFGQGGRPVIYDSSGDWLPNDERYRWVKYDPINGDDSTWEREWRIKTEGLALDPKHTLVIVPTSDEAFNLSYDNAVEEADISGGPDGIEYNGMYHVPKWLAVSLDLFGVDFNPQTKRPDS